jgi:hypothetical protein
VAKSLGLAALLLAAGAASVQQAAPPRGTPGGSSAPPVRQVDDKSATPVVPPVAYDEKEAEQAIQLEPPGPDRGPRIESEDALKERWRQELQQERLLQSLRLNAPFLPLLAVVP